MALPLAYLVALRLWDARHVGPDKIPLQRILWHGAAGTGAGLVGILPLLWFHQHAFGSIFTTGYSFTGQSRAFSWAYFAVHFPFALKTLCSLPTGLFILFPLGVAALFVKRWVPVRHAVFLALASLPTLFLYGAYYWVNTAEPVMYVRFFLTLFPVLLIAALIPTDVFSRRWPVVRYVLVGLLVILTSVNLSEAPDENRIEGSAVTDLAATRLAQENLPPDAVILANGYASFSHWLSHWLSLRCLVPFAEDQLDCAHRT